MNFPQARLAPHSIGLPALLAVLLAVLATGFPATAAESKRTRVAIGPFFAPAANEGLRQASQTLPELLMAELSHQPRFELVEREKVQGIWNELKLTSSGLVARETVAKLGQVLACDWVVSGSLVQAGGKTYIWTKVIDVRSGVVLDLKDSAYEGSDFTRTIGGISAFLAQAGSQPRGRQFIAMGPLLDWNPPNSPKRDDWSRRIATLIESKFLNAGYGVVEMAAIGPIFEERRLESAGLTGLPERRVKLQAAFWLVDGGCQWVEGEPLKLNVVLRVQQVGGPEEIIQLIKTPGESLEKEVLETLSRVLAKTNLLSQPNPNPNAEADLLVARGAELAERRVPYYRGPPQPRPAQSTPRAAPWERYKRTTESHKKSLETGKALLANYERILLRDPDNQEAKRMYAYTLLAESDAEPARRERALELLRAVAANKKDPVTAGRAHELLTNAPMVAMCASVFALKRPTDLPSLNQASEENPSDLEIKCDLGAALLGVPRAADRDRGRTLLTEVAAGDRADQVARARRLLAEPERSPAGHELAAKPGGNDALFQSGAAQPSAPEAAAPAAEPEEDSVTAARREFLQKNFSKFVPAKFAIDGPQVAVFQTLPVNESLFDYDGMHYCGFRFIAPTQMDGDLRWMWLFAKTETQEEFIARNFFWYIVPKAGKMHGFDNYYSDPVASYSKLRLRFPYTTTFISQDLPRQRLQPGQEYAIWFAFNESKLPDIAFALTIRSDNGYKHFGILPMQ